MLVDNKFIYLSLPRCASTAFHYSCIVNDINVQTFDTKWESQNSNIDFKSINKLDLMYHILHGHESLYHLQSKFGKNHPVISVRRQRHERFYSLYKHILFDLKRTGFHEIYEKLSNLTVDELFFFTKEDIITKKQRWDKINEFLYDLKLLDKKINIKKSLKIGESYVDFLKNNVSEYAINVIDILLTPYSYWTNNNQNIIWFEFDELNKLEEWVSTTLEKPFILHSVNSSKHIDSKITLNDDFIIKYDSIYDYYDLPKLTKTII
jgi:hypothetical protein